MANDARRTSNLFRHLKERYNLCGYCLERQIGKRINRSRRDRPSSLSACYICRGVMEMLDQISKRILANAQEYDFDSFLIGAALPVQIYEREDAIRARLKIRGKENIKNQLTREIGIRFSKSTGKKVDYLKPDLTINLTIDKENSVELALKSSPLSLFGRYTKKTPGLPQKQDRCPQCEGRGCAGCEQSGLSGRQSVEGVISKGLVTLTKGQAPKFSWIGSEDRESLVLGKGRPFYVRVFNPRRRNVKKRIRITDSSVEAVLRALPNDGNSLLGAQTRFTVKTRILVKCDSMVTKTDLKRLDLLSNSKVTFQNKSKVAVKRIYSAKARQIDGNNFSLTIEADGGLMIKQFVGGEEYMKPNISEILKAKCDCVTFDILDVRIQ